MLPLYPSVSLTLRSRNYNSVGVVYKKPLPVPPAEKPAAPQGTTERMKKHPVVPFSLDDFLEKDYGTSKKRSRFEMERPAFDAESVVAESTLPSLFIPKERVVPKSLVDKVCKFLRKFTSGKTRELLLRDCKDEDWSGNDAGKDASTVCSTMSHKAWLLVQQISLCNTHKKEFINRVFGERFERSKIRSSLWKRCASVIQEIYNETSSMSSWMFHVSNGSTKGKGKKTVDWIANEGLTQHRKVMNDLFSRADQSLSQLRDL
jgi:hypothetical protein